MAGGIMIPLSCGIIYVVHPDPNSTSLVNLWLYIVGVMLFVGAIGTYLWIKHDGKVLRMSGALGYAICAIALCVMAYKIATHEPVPIHQ